MHPKKKCRTHQSVNSERNFRHFVLERPSRGACDCLKPWVKLDRMLFVSKVSESEGQIGARLIIIEIGRRERRDLVETVGQGVAVDAELARRRQLSTVLLQPDAQGAHAGQRRCILADLSPLVRVLL